MRAYLRRKRGDPLYDTSQLFDAKERLCYDTEGGGGSCNEAIPPMFSNLLFYAKLAETCEDTDGECSEIDMDSGEDFDSDEDVWLPGTSYSTRAAYRVDHEKFLEWSRFLLWAPM